MGQYATGTDEQIEGHHVDERLTTFRLGEDIRQGALCLHSLEAHGQLTGRPGVCLVTRGPGATNASIGVHAARQNSTPMLLLVGQVELEHRGLEAFQEVEYRSFFDDLAKWVVEVQSADDIPAIVERAMIVA